VRPERKKRKPGKGLIAGGKREKREGTRKTGRLLTSSSSLPKATLCGRNTEGEKGHWGEKKWKKEGGEKERKVCFKAFLGKSFLSISLCWKEGGRRQIGETNADEEGEKKKGEV